MEKWRKEIEEILSKSWTVDRWLIHDLVRQQKADPAYEATLAAMSHLTKAMRLLGAGPGTTSETEMKEKIKKSCVEAGLPIEAINSFFALLERQDPLKPGDRPDGETNESPGDDT